MFRWIRNLKIDAELAEIISEGTQVTLVAQCALREIPTNVEAEPGKGAIADEIIGLVVRARKSFLAYQRNSMFKP